MKIVLLLFLSSSIFWANLACAELPVVTPLAIDLDVTYFDNEQNFMIKPPLDWQPRITLNSTIFVPPETELESRSALAHIEIRYFKTEQGYTPEEFKDLIYNILKQTENIRNIKILEYGGRPSKAYTEIISEAQQKRGTMILYQKSFLTSNGYFSVTASSIKEKWEIVKPLLKKSISTFNIIN